MRYGGRDLARDTYAGIDLQPAVRRKVVAPAPVQPVVHEPVPWHEAKRKMRQLVATNSLTSKVKRDA